MWQRYDAFMIGRTIAIGDIHGCSIALARLIEAVDPKQEDTLVTLGDYVNRGIDSQGVLDQLIDLSGRCRLKPLLGNHEEMLLANRATRIVVDDPIVLEPGIERFLSRHFDFLDSCQTYYETHTHFFVHANYKPQVPLDRQDRFTLLWLSLRDYVPEGPHGSGKTAIVGHTPQRSGEILDFGYLKCIDTDCCHGGWLTALDVASGHVWQVNAQGQLRG
jgi:serine/threonine protein phosphatase 1